MSVQISLPGFSTEPVAPDRLLLLIYPEVPTATRIRSLAENLRAKHKLTGRVVAAERLHITLFHLGNYHGLPLSQIRTATEAANRVVAAPFNVEFDQAESFVVKPGQHPLVLLGGNGVDQVKTFHRTFGTALSKAGLGDRGFPEINPHVTLLRDPNIIPKEPVDPVSWTVREFALVHSQPKIGRHNLLGRWPLQG